MARAREALTVTGRWLCLLPSLLLLCAAFAPPARAQLRYAVQEELGAGTFVGNIAKDLGTDVIRLNSRGLKLVSRSQKQHFQVNMNTGILVTNERLDREELCAESATCKLNLELVIDSPLEMHRLEIEVLDVNDHAPLFTEQEIIINIFESAVPGSRFPLVSAIDLDIGRNGLQGYRLSRSDYFDIATVTNSDKSTSIALSLAKSLDREEQAQHALTVTAFDGGDPKRSGSMAIIVNVDDVNDNAPRFDKAEYRFKLLENAPIGTTVARLNATDSDEGTNGEVRYFFNKRVPMSVQNTFRLEEATGVITVQQNIDYEDIKGYKFSVEALDRGPFSVAGHRQVIVEVVDMNDNAPEITVTSVSSPVPEDATPRTVIALMVVSDKDSGDNGQVVCSVSTAHPFTLQNPFNNHYSLILRDPLDRESAEEHSITITATDRGSPPLTTSATLRVRVSDVNDNRPTFAQPSYAMYVIENNVPGTHVFTISATDADAKENGYLTYSVTANATLDSYISINSENGKVHALKSFDYEELQHLQFEVHARDAGVPPLSSSVPVHLFIQDQNDNAPAILHSHSQTETHSIESISRPAASGQLIFKVRAVDADSGYNAWLAYDMVQAKVAPLFRVGESTGEVRTARAMREQDGNQHSFVILVKDHGEPALSSTVTFTITFTDNKKEITTEFRKQPESSDSISDVNLYLVISIALISFVFLVTVIIFVALKIHRGRENKPVFDQSDCGTNRGSWYYTLNNTLKVCLANPSPAAVLQFNSLRPQHPGDGTMNWTPAAAEEQRRQPSVDDLLMIAETKMAPNLHQELTYRMFSQSPAAFSRHANTAAFEPPSQQEASLVLCPPYPHL